MRYWEYIRQKGREMEKRKEPNFEVGDKVVGTFLAPVELTSSVGVVKEKTQSGYLVEWEGPKGLQYMFTDEIMLDKTSEDNVNHPSHYNQHGVECIEAIRASLGDEFESYCKGNVLKYLWRYKYKNGVEDLKKAQVYLNWMVEAATKDG